MVGAPQQEYAMHHSGDAGRGGEWTGRRVRALVRGAMVQSSIKRDRQVGGAGALWRSVDSAGQIKLSVGGFG